jgi:hypothetical protein
MENQGDNPRLLRGEAHSLDRMLPFPPAQGPTGHMSVPIDPSCPFRPVWHDLSLKGRHQALRVVGWGEGEVPRAAPEPNEPNALALSDCNRTNFPLSLAPYSLERIASGPSAEGKGRMVRIS